jgi:hypothetical protein
MTVINVLYLPRDDRLRLFVRLALDFVEEVYRDDVLSGLKFVSFDRDDKFDVEQAKYIADREGFGLEPKSPLFEWPHYNDKYRYVWVPISRREKISYIFDVVAHEVTHHAFDKLSAKDRMALAVALRNDLGVEVDEIIVRHRPSSALVKDIAKIMGETVTRYIVYNYFTALEREPRTPTPLTDIRSFAEAGYFTSTVWPPRSKYRAEVLSIIYYKMAYNDLPNYRRAIHEMFMKLIKKLPVDVLESNRAKYEILYREEPIVQSF